MKKKWSSLLAITVALSLAACSGNQGAADGESGNPSGSQTSESVSASSSTNHGDSLNFGITAEPSTLDPSKSGNFMTHMMQFQVYDCLFYEDPNGELIPGLAEDYEISEDGLEYTFHIREGVKFHNGDLLTAEDVAFTFENVIKSTYATRMTGHIAKCEVIDDYTVLMTLKYPFSSHIFTLSTAQTSIINKKAYEADPDGYARNPIGTGPYKFVEWAVGEKIVLEAFEDYYRGEAPIKNVTFRFYTDGTTGALALENNEIDILNVPPVATKRAIDDAEQLTWYSEGSTSEFAIWFNCRDGVFSDVRLRQAVAAVINREEVIYGALEGLGTAEYCAAPSTVFGHVDFDTDTIDLDKAKQLLSEAGYPNGLDTTVKIADSTTNKAIAEIIQAQLSQVGISLNIEILEAAAFNEDVSHNGEFDMAIIALSYTIPDADFLLYPDFHSSQIDQVSGNISRYANTCLDELLEEGRGSQNQEERKKIYEEALTILKDDAVVIPVYASLTNVAANKDLKQVKAHPIYRYYVYNLSWE